jgi:hypothetical protein
MVVLDRDPDAARPGPSGPDSYRQQSESEFTVARRRCPCAPMNRNARARAVSRA